MLKAITCFNLVIEVLVVSRTVGETQHHSDIVSFNLVIEVLVVSSYGWLSIADFDTTDLFQSRNRGSCRFKVVCRVETRHGETCFNLVIEVLVVSSRRSDTGRSEDNTSFNLVIEVLVVSSTCVAALRKVLVSGFNLVIEVLVVSSPEKTAISQTCLTHGFNLVIEVLVVSSLLFRSWQGWLALCFNLVIEVLVVSSLANEVAAASAAMFQSRNRGSCRFKCSLLAL